MRKDTRTEQAFRRRFAILILLHSGPCTFEMIITSLANDGFFFHDHALGAVKTAQLQKYQLEQDIEALRVSNCDIRYERKSKRYRWDNSATSNVLESASKYALCCSWLIPRCLITRLVLLWSYSRSPGRFPSGRSHCPRRHVQVEAEHAKCLYNDIHGGVLI
ncbi:MAG: hypothetical protein ACXVCM_25140, partial [Ktedonobacteraceae bacterium]